MFVTPDGIERSLIPGSLAKARLDDGRVTKSMYQAVAVRKPLMAVASVNDKGSLVIFDEKDRSFFPAPTKT